MPEQSLAGSKRLIIKESGEVARMVIEGSFHVVAEIGLLIKT